MNNKWLFLVLIFLGTGLEILGDVYFKKWAIGGRHLFLWIGFIIYTAGTIFWALSLKHGSLSKAITIFTILNLIIVVIIGTTFFRENLTLYNKIGIITGILSIILIQL